MTAAQDDLVSQLAEEIVTEAWLWAGGDAEQLEEACGILAKTRYLEGGSMTDDSERHYLVTWTIDAWAGHPEKAAMQALKIQRDQASTATVFDVLDKETGESVRVDLWEPDPPDGEEGELP